MQHNEKLISAIIITAGFFLIFSLLPCSAIAEDTESGHLLGQQRFLNYEITGISLNTPLENIPSILESHGYTQTSDTTYTRQIQVPGQRKSIYRIEVDDTPTLHQITYFRGQSGGRVKSSVLQKKPIPADEIIMIEELYQMICADISPQLQETRSCQAVTNTLRTFGHGEFLQYGSNFSAQLNASADSTTIGIKYFKE